MKRYSSLIAAILVLFWGSASHALVDVEVLSPITCTRSTGAPVTETFTFPGLAGAATVKLCNGSLEDDSIERVSSSTVSVNGQEVFGPSNFNQNVDYLETQVTLSEGQNTLEVVLKGKPGGQVTIQIRQEVDAGGAAFIGPEGGVAEVTDPANPCCGTKVEILEGTVDSYTLFTISEWPGLQPPNSFTAVSNGVRINSQSPLNEYVLVTCPLNTSVTDEDILFASRFDQENGKWYTLPLIDVNYEDHTVTFLTDQFSGIVIQVSGSTATVPFEKSTGFSVPEDCFVYNNAHGRCFGIANYSVWYYLMPYSPKLRCCWDYSTGAAAALSAKN